MNPAPSIKFQVSPVVRARLDKCADFHGIGHNDPSANELCKLVCTQFSLIPPAKLFPALAALRPFQYEAPPKTV